MEEKKKEKLTEHVLEVAVEKRLSCKRIFEIAAEFDCLPAEIGKICNEHRIKIFGCQIGCF